MKYLTSEDLQKPEVRFYWMDGGDGKVTYRTTVDGKKLEETVEFRVKKQKFILHVEAAPANVYGQMTLGTSFPGGGRCCLSSGSEDFNSDVEECQKWEEELKELRKKYHKNCAGNGPGDQEGQRACTALYQSMVQTNAKIEELCRPDGIQYTIKFSAEPQDNTPGEVQFVQLVSTSMGKSASPSALDGCYPFFKYGPYSTTDMPGFPADRRLPFEKHCYDFEMYLMFQPKGENNEWLPLKKAPWSWCGAIRCDGHYCTEDKTAARIPPSGQAAECSRYPEWSRCSSPGSDSRGSRMHRDMSHSPG